MDQLVTMLADNPTLIKSAREHLWRTLGEIDDEHAHGVDKDLAWSLVERSYGVPVKPRL